MKRLGLLGAGTVGSALAQLINTRNLNATISKVLVRDTSKTREGIKPEALTTNPQEVLDNCDILVELMGGTEQAGDLTLEALKAGKSVVTANKAVLAERWQELEPYLKKGQVHFEAAVMAGTPVIGPLTNALRGSSPLELHAILNGTCNYMLSELENGVSYQDALAEAQRLGYAEADPTLDVGGFDAAHKLTVLARLVFDPKVTWESVEANTKGIQALSPQMMQDAINKQGRIRLLGSIYPQANAWQVKVRPVFLPLSHPMATAASNKNALFFKGDAIGDVFITGAGAGGKETASAVLADIMNVLENKLGPSLLAQAAAVPKSADIEVLEEIN